MKELEELRKLYKDDCHKRMIHTQLLEKVDFDLYPKYVSNRGCFSDLELKTCFVLAVDRLLTQRSRDGEWMDYSDLNWIMGKFIEQEIQDRKGLKVVMSSKLTNAVKKFGENGRQKKLHLNVMESIRGVFGLSNNGNVHLYEQELEVTRSEISRFLFEEYGEELRDDCIAHYIYGTSFRDLAYVRGIAYQNVHKHLSRAWKSLIEYFRLDEKLAVTVTSECLSAEAKLPL